MMAKEKTVMFNIEEMEAINFCRTLGRYGVRFEISELKSIPREDDETKRRYYRVFMVRASKKQMDELCKELNVN